MHYKNYHERGERRLSEVAFLPAKLHNAISIWVSPLEDFIHSSQFTKTPPTTTSCIIIPFSLHLECSSAKGQIINWLQSSKIKSICCFPIWETPGKKATKVSIGWFLKSILPAQNAENKPPYISPAVLLRLFCHDYKDYARARAECFSTLLLLTAQSVWKHVRQNFQHHYPKCLQSNCWQLSNSWVASKNIHAIHRQRTLDGEQAKILIFEVTTYKQVLQQTTIEECRNANVRLLKVVARLYKQWKEMRSILKIFLSSLF